MVELLPARFGAWEEARKQFSRLKSCVMKCYLSVMKNNSKRHSGELIRVESMRNVDGSRIIDGYVILVKVFRPEPLYVISYFFVFS